MRYTNRKFFIGLASLCVIVLVCRKLYDPTSSQTLEVRRRTNNQEPNNRKALEIVVEQRNQLSQMTNQKQKKIGQMQCEKADKSKKATSETGGWCMRTGTPKGGHRVDKTLVKALADFFEGKYVGSFGDGPGRYKELVLAAGKVKGYDAYDGAPFCEMTSNGRVQFLDLTIPQFGLPMYDWILSLEVAEHIPQNFESAYIDNIVRHAKEGVVLSWARIGQGGYSHVNNRPFEYVKDLMEKNSFQHDELVSQKLRNSSSLPWLRKNINVYSRKRMPTSSENMKIFT